jgi:hypothetical protein
MQERDTEARRNAPTLPPSAEETAAIAAFEVKLTSDAAEFRARRDATLALWAALTEAA